MPLDTCSCCGKCAYYLVREGQQLFWVLQGHARAAEAFEKETGTSHHLDIEGTKIRMHVRKSVEEGKSEHAIEQVIDLNPQILEDRPELLFRLKKQQFIEMVEKGEAEAALRFAEEELTHRVENNENLLREMEEAMSLLLFEKPESSPVAYLLKKSHRQKTAHELNCAILESESHAGNPKLPNLLKLVTWSQNRLKGIAEYPYLPVRAEAMFVVPESHQGGLIISEDDDDDDEDEEIEDFPEAPQDEPMPDAGPRLLSP